MTLIAAANLLRSYNDSLAGDPGFVKLAGWNVPAVLRDDSDLLVSAARRAVRTAIIRARPLDLS